MSLQILTSPARTALLAASLAVLPLGAAQADRFNRSVESIHQPVVQRSDYVLDVSANGLDPVESARVHEWLDAIDLRYGDRVGVDSQAGGKASNVDIAAIVEGYGLFLSAGTPVTEGAIAPGQVRIVVSRSTATVPRCPDYSQASQPNFTASASSNYGCATNSNLAAMIADPEDLVRGQDKRGTDAETATKAIRIWRNTDPTGKNGLKVESTKGGN